MTGKILGIFAVLILYQSDLKFIKVFHCGAVWTAQGYFSFI